MVKHRGGRGRAKRRRCAFVVGEECGNVPAPCQTSLKEVRPHSAGVGKPGEDGAHTGERGSKLHRPLRGYVEERKQRGEKEKTRRRSVVSEACITRLPLSYDLPPLLTPSLTSYTPHPQSVVRVRVCEFSQSTPPPPPPPPLFRVSLPGLV